MKKILLSLVLLVTLLTVGIGCSKAKSEATTEILPTLETKSNAENQVWVGTFQIVWNELVDNIVKSPVKFVDGPSVVADSLNRKEFSKVELSDKAYYTKYGSVSPKLKKEIEKGIKKKFKEKSDILNSFDWREDKAKLFVYAMLKKDFKFLEEYNKLDKGKFGSSPNLVEYFGIDKKSDAVLYKTVNVLFYNSPNDFAVKLLTKGDDEVLLYRTDSDKTLAEYYEDLVANTTVYKGNRAFTNLDTLKVPNVSFYMQTSFPELEGHQIVGSDFVIDKTIETVDFNMNNKGVKLKSEAAIMMKMTALSPENNRYFVFNDQFVLFMIEKGRRVPYYAMKVSNLEELNSHKK